MWNLASTLGITSLALEKMVFNEQPRHLDGRSPCRCLQDTVCAAVSFPQGSHASSLEATDSALPALSGCHIADGAVEHGLICLSPLPLFCCGELKSATHQQ